MYCTSYCHLYSVFKSCKLSCKSTVPCNVNLKAHSVVCKTRSLSCLPSAYNTYMYMYEPYQCIFCTFSVDFPCTFCTDVSDFNTKDTVTFDAGKTTASFPFNALCDTVEEGNEIVTLVLEVQKQDQHRISIIGNDHIEVVIVGKRHTTAITVPFSSVIVSVNADRNLLQVTFISCQRRQTNATHTYDCAFFAQLCIILTHVQLCMILTHILHLLCFPHLLYCR